LADQNPLITIDLLQELMVCCRGEWAFSKWARNHGQEAPQPGWGQFQRLHSAPPANS